MNDIFQDQSFNKPFFVTYINTSSFSFYFILFALGDTLNCQRRRKAYEVLDDEENHRPQTLRDSVDSRASNESLVGAVVKAVVDVTKAKIRHRLQRHREHSQNVSDTPTHVDTDLASMEKLTLREHSCLGAMFCSLWFLANWASNASLAYTTVASSTILSSMSGFFTLLIGAVVGVERFSLTKLLAVLVSILGVILVSTSDNSHASDSTQKNNAPFALFGDFLALTGAFLYGAYIILLKTRIRDESRIDMPLFFGFVGIFNILMLWPMFIVLHYVGLEKFGLPPSSTVWMMVLINAFFGTFLSDYLWLLSMLKTSPLVVTLGLSLTIPLALIGDTIYKHISLGIAYYFGAILVLVAFITVNLAALTESLNWAADPTNAASTVAASLLDAAEETILKEHQRETQLTRGESSHRPVLHSPPSSSSSRSSISANDLLKYVVNSVDQA
ncbi:uncharacterized protein VTP21DRAFT_1363 [Calcarisporiella thermophila]|uniref:uncharacterized protein n=1 Tax=Calcarisporiella thermophila TaxID=911321 RepID=UPI003744056D